MHKMKMISRDTTVWYLRIHHMHPVPPEGEVCTLLGAELLSLSVRERPWLCWTELCWAELLWAPPHVELQHEEEEPLPYPCKAHTSHNIQ